MGCAVDNHNMCHIYVIMKYQFFHEIATNFTYKNYKSKSIIEKRASHVTNLHFSVGSCEPSIAEYLLILKETKLLL